MSRIPKRRLMRAFASGALPTWLWMVFTGCIFPIECRAQAVSVAEVSGVVTDPSGSPVSGATVQLTQTDTNSSRNATTDNQGLYVMPALPVGAYRLDVSTPGFKSYTQSGILLQVGDNVRINVAMQIGSLNEHIDVTASASMVETSENAVSEVIDTRRILDLPLNGRQPTQLILLSGGAVSAPVGDMAGPKAFYSSVTISIAGGQSGAVNYLSDGGDHNDAVMNINLPFPFPDALQEFTVQTSTVPAVTDFIQEAWSTRSQNPVRTTGTAIYLNLFATVISTHATSLRPPTIHLSETSSAERLADG